MIESQDAYANTRSHNDTLTLIFTHPETHTHTQAVCEDGRKRAPGLVVLTLTSPDSVKCSSADPFCMMC